MGAHLPCPPLHSPPCTGDNGDGDAAKGHSPHATACSTGPDPAHTPSPTQKGLKFPDSALQ